MDWNKHFRSRLTSAEIAVRVVQSGQRVFMTGNSSVPRHLLSSLVEYSRYLTNVELCQPLTIADKSYLVEQLRGHLRVNSLFISPNVRHAVNKGEADFTPVLLSQLPLLVKRNILPVDVAMLHLSPPDSEGYCTLGLEAGLMKTISESAKLVIAEVNSQMPTTYGDTRLHIDQVSHLVEVDYPLAEVPVPTQFDAATIRIAELIAELIPDGATIQLGIGEIPNAILSMLGSKRHLGIHAELISDGIIYLVECGVITGQRKTIHLGKIVAGFGFGTSRLHKWLHQNSLVELHRTEYVNNPFTIAQNYKMTAVNSAIEIDLTGQVCADSIGTKLYSGVGGQIDFIYGAGLSDGGIPVIALPATLATEEGLQSRIVPTLKSGAGVTTSRNHIHYVVTENGCVDLFGKSIRERAQLLISIASPAFRDLLTFEARKFNYI